jgi:ankyrin repeat protein
MQTTPEAVVQPRQESTFIRWLMAAAMMVLVAMFVGWGKWPDRESDQQVLAEAASQGDCLKLARMLKEGVPFNEADTVGVTPLIYAATAGQSQAAAVLLNAGADPNQTSRFGLSPLQMAALRGNVETVKVLVGRGARIDHTDPQGGTPLMVASAAGHCEIVDLLLEAGADPTRTNSAGHTALDLAREATSSPSVIASLRIASMKRRAIPMASVNG